MSETIHWKNVAKFIYYSFCDRRQEEIECADPTFRAKLSQWAVCLLSWWRQREMIMNDVASARAAKRRKLCTSTPEERQLCGYRHAKSDRSATHIQLIQHRCWNESKNLARKWYEGSCTANFIQHRTHHVGMTSPQLPSNASSTAIAFLFGGRHVHDIILYIFDKALCSTRRVEDWRAIFRRRPPPQKKILFVLLGF